MTGLFGALSTAVTGLDAQSVETSVISNNIANVNTVGYKQTATSFETLVTGAGGATFSSGGVLSNTNSLVDEQGQLQNTNSATDLAISGKGFFVVNSSSDGTGDVAYTRAGSFTQDSLGNFVNAQGDYLQGWPLDRNGNLPGAPGNPNTNSPNNLSSLQTVNVQSATGNAAQTTTLALSANLKASQGVFPGAAATVNPDTLTVNSRQPASAIIVPGVLDGTALSNNIDNVARGDRFTVSTGAGVNYTFSYGGFTYSRSVSTGALGDSQQPTKLGPLVLSQTPFTTTSSSKTVTVASANSGLVAGDVVTLTGNDPATPIGGIVGGDFNGTFVVQSADANGFTIQVADAASAGGAGNATGGTTGIAVQTRPFSGTILDANSPTALFLGTTTTAPFTAAALSFTITVNTATGNNTSTFTYTSSTPNGQLGQFNTLNNLADAISAQSGLTARVSNGRLYVSADDPNQAVTFANGSTTGTTSGSTVLSGIDWVGELGLQAIPSSQNTFDSLQSLADQVNASDGISASVSNALTAATLAINVDDPLDTISFSDPAIAVAAPLVSATPFTTTAAAGANDGKTITVNTSGATGLRTGDLVTIATPTVPAPVATTFDTTNGSQIIAINQANSFTAGQDIYIDPSTLPNYPNGAIDGIPYTDLVGNFTVLGTATSPVAPANPTGTKFYIQVASKATSTAAGVGGGDTLMAEATYNGIPVSDLNGQFQVTVTGPSTYTIQVAHGANASGTTGEAGIDVTPPTNSGSVLAELGLVTTLNGASFSPQSVGPLGPEYDAGDSSKNMAGGIITPQFSQNVQIFDSLGTAHNLKISFIKTATNTWAVEVYAATTADVSSTYTDGLLASGSLVFNGDGSLHSVSSGLSTDVGVIWSDGADNSSVAFNWGTAGRSASSSGTGQVGQTDGMQQFAADYAVNFVNQNGNAVGQLTSVSVTTLGVVVANFSNGQSEKLYQLPLALFSAPNHLQSLSGNLYSQTDGSGQPNLRVAGTSGSGTLQPSALETSTVDLATQLTSLIVAQSAYGANAKVVTVVSGLEQTLNQSIQG